MPNPNFIVALVGAIVLLFILLRGRRFFSYVFPIISQIVAVICILTAIAIFLIVLYLFWINKDNRLMLHQHELYVVKTSANVRPNPNTQNNSLGTLDTGTTIQAVTVVTGEPVNGNNEWISFKYQDREAYVWSGLVVTQTPEKDATPVLLVTVTPTPARQATATVRPSLQPTEVLFLSPRRCGYVYDQPRFSAFPVGKLVPIDFHPVVTHVSGGDVNGSQDWLQLKYNRRDAYIPLSFVEVKYRPYSFAPTPPSFSCNCSKQCSDIRSCAEAFYQLRNCGCAKRDGDNDGIPCNELCKCRN